MPPALNAAEHVGAATTAGSADEWHGLSTATLSTNDQMYWRITADCFSDIVHYSSLVCIQCFIVLLQHISAVLCCLFTVGQQLSHGTWQIISHTSLKSCIFSIPGLDVISFLFDCSFECFLVCSLHWCKHCCHELPFLSAGPWTQQRFHGRFYQCHRCLLWTARAETVSTCSNSTGPDSLNCCVGLGLDV